MAASKTTRVAIQGAVLTIEGLFRGQIGGDGGDCREEEVKWRI